MERSGIKRVQPVRTERRGISAWSGLESLEGRLLLTVAGGGGAVLAGFNSNTLGATDDASSPAVTLPFAVNFFGYNGGSANQLWVNNNGNVTFDQPYPTFTPFGLTTNIGRPIIAPFFADVDTRGPGSGVVSYGAGSVDVGGGNIRQAFGVNWPGVGYFEQNTDKLDTFQLILIDRSDVAAGDFDIEFNYGQIQWETGDWSGGASGLGGTSASAGFSNGSGSAGTFFQIAGSLVNGALLDSNLVTGLIHGSTNSAVPGRCIFHAYAGSVDVPPTVTSPGDQAATVGSVATFNLGSFTDPNGGPWTADVNWGDGSADSSSSVPTAGSLGALDHIYSSAGNRKVSVTVTDSTGLAGSATFGANVISSPLLGSGGFFVAGTEGGDCGPQTVAMFTDPGGAQAAGNYVATISWGDGQPASAGKITYDSARGAFVVTGQHTYHSYGPFTVRTTIACVGGSGATGPITSTAIVSNLPPQVATVATSSPNGQSSVNRSVVLSASFTDPGTLDTHTATIDWGDGTFAGAAKVADGSGSGTVAGGHVYAQVGQYTVTATVQEADGSTATMAAGALISGAGIHNGVLEVVGTNQKDTILIRRNAKGLIEVDAGFLPGGSKSFPASTVTSLHVWGYGGDDYIQVANSVTVPAILDGGDGNDTLLAGGGPSIVLGGAGNNALYGGIGNNVLVGGSGNNRLFSGLRSDILIGGTGQGRLQAMGGGNTLLIGGATAYDTDLTALAALRDEWASRASLNVRVKNLQTGGGLTGGRALDATTVLANGSADTLVGNMASNWFWRNTAAGAVDILSHLKATDIVSDIGGSASAGRRR